MRPEFLFKFFSEALAVDSTSVQSAPQAAEELRDELQQLAFEFYSG